MAGHRITITYDEDTGTITAEHRCVQTVGGLDVSISEPIELADADGAREVLKALIDTNRAEMERHAGPAAIRHAAALAGELPADTKALKLGGSLGPIGNIERD